MSILFTMINLVKLNKLNNICSDILAKGVLLTCLWATCCLWLTVFSLIYRNWWIRTYLRPGRSINREPCLGGSWICCRLIVQVSYNYCAYVNLVTMHNFFFQLAKHEGMMNFFKVLFALIYKTNTVFDCIFKKIYYD